MLPVETNTRPTDMVADKPYSRLGNTGGELLDDLLDRIHQYLGAPLQIDANNPVAPKVVYEAGVYTLPDGRRMASYRGGKLPQITSGEIDFDAGTISSGTVLSFTPPTMVLNNYVRALVSFSLGKNAISVTFGSQDSVLANASVPTPVKGYQPVAIVELLAQAAGSGAGTFNNVQKTDIVSIFGASDSDPIEEVQVVSGSPASVFTLTTIAIPTDRMRLDVYVNGIKYIQGTHYTVTNDTTVTFDENVSVNAEVVFRVE